MPRKLPDSVRRRAAAGPTDLPRAPTPPDAPGGLRRRELLRAAGAAGAAALAGGGALALMACEKKAPATRSERRIHLLQWSNFIKDADLELQRQAAEFESQTGVQVTIEFVNANDLNARFTAAVESGNGADILQLMSNQPHLYAGGLADVEDVVQDVADMHGEYFPIAQASAQVDGVWRAVPYWIGSGSVVYRTDIFEELGVERFPETYAEYLEVGQRLKARGTPVGQAMGHSFGDPPGWCYAMLWAFGGRERDEDGAVAINTAETRAAIEFNTAFYHAACDQGGLSWDDTANNRAFLAGTIAATLNGASIYFVARRNAEQYPHLVGNLNHARLPRGPAGRYNGSLNFQNGIARYSTEKAACKDFIRFLMAKENYEKWFLISQGYSQGPTTPWEAHSFWDENPEVAAYRHNARTARNNGWAGPYDRMSSEVFSKYIVVDMFARALQGVDTPASAAAWAEKEMKLVYDRG